MCCKFVSVFVDEKTTDRFDGDIIKIIAGIASAVIAIAVILLVVICYILCNNVRYACSNTSNKRNICLMIIVLENPQEKNCE